MALESDQLLGNIRFVGHDRHFLGVGAGQVILDVDGHAHGLGKLVQGDIGRAPGGVAEAGGRCPLGSWYRGQWRDCWEHGRCPFRKSLCGYWLKRSRMAEKLYAVVIFPQILVHFLAPEFSQRGRRFGLESGGLGIGRADAVDTGEESLLPDLAGCEIVPRGRGRKR